AVALAFASPPAFRAFIAEDGIVEYASSLSWLAAAACALTALSLDTRQFERKLAFYLPLIASCVFCGGEGISWRQRLVHCPTPAFSPLSLWGYYTQMDEEIWEFYAALGFLALAALDLTHRLAETRRTRVPPSYAQRAAPTLQRVVQ